MFRLPSVDDANILPGIFSVSPDKAVRFSKGNLYWDGDEFRFEAKQTDYPTRWDTKHVGHFFWTPTASESYKYSCNYETWSLSDVAFFAESTGGMTVEGTSGLFAPTAKEWYYLLKTRENASSLSKFFVTVDEQQYCLILAPDGFTGTLKSSYTLEEVNALGLVCLSASGSREDSDVYNGGREARYWSSTLLADEYDDEDTEGYAACLVVGCDMEDDPTTTSARGRARSIRLVVRAK